MSPRQVRIQEKVDEWFSTEDQLQVVYHLEGPGNTVRLIQVTEATPASPNYVACFGFAPTDDFEFPLALSQVTPGEWEDIKAGKLFLPQGWEVDSAREVPPTKGG